MPFIEQISKLEPEYQPVYDAWKADPNPKTSASLLKSIDRDIQRGIRAHIGASNPLLYSKARRMALQAVNNYDPKQAKLGTHIVNRLQGLKRVSRQQQTAIRVPERLALERQRIDRARADLLDWYGRDPSLDELADETGLSSRRIEYIRKFGGEMAEGTAMTQRHAEDTPYMPSVVEQGSDPWVDIVYSSLSPPQQKILEWTLGMHGEPVLTNQQIAKRLGVTPGAISQRRLKIQQELDNRPTGPILE
jgi:RNA polymerase primary sigma factor